MIPTQTELDQFRQRIKPLKDVAGPLLPALHIAHEMFGYIPVDVEEILHSEFRMSNAKIHGVATFYEQFHTTPTGKHLIGVCTGTACHIDGAKAVRQCITEILGIKEGETTADRSFTMVPIKCLGRCGSAPNLMVDDDVYERVSRTEVPEILNNYR